MVAKKYVTLEKVIKELKIKQVIAECGSDSTARGIIGLAGKDTNIEVPCGITLYNGNGILLGKSIFFQTL